MILAGPQASLVSFSACLWDTSGLYVCFIATILNVVQVFCIIIMAFGHYVLREEKTYITSHISQSDKVSALLRPHLMNHYMSLLGNWYGLYCTLCSLEKMITLCNRIIWYYFSGEVSSQIWTRIRTCYSGFWEIISSILWIFSVSF